MKRINRDLGNTNSYRNKKNVSRDGLNSRMGTAQNRTRELEYQAKEFSQKATQEIKR